MAGAVHIAMLIFGRLLIGYSVGSITGASPVFGAEIAKTNQRAKITGLNQMMIAWGFFIALWTGFGEGRWDNQHQWRLGFAIQAIPALCLGLGVLFLPESPRWLCLKGRYEEAEQSFRHYHFDGNNDTWCSTEFAIIRINIEAELQAQGSLTWADLLGNLAFRRRLFVGSFIWAAAMLSGISFVQYYQTAIYATLQFDQGQQLLVGGLNGSIGALACCLALFLVDRVGRRKILITGSLLLTISYTIITILAAIFPARPGMPTDAAAQRGLIACIFSVTANYGATLGPMTWIIPPEVFTTELRAKANAIVQIIHYSISIIITQCSPIALARIGWRYYILFIVSNAICVVVFALVYPETRGKSLEEIDEIFGDVPVIHENDLGLTADDKIAAEKVEDRDFKVQI